MKDINGRLLNADGTSTPLATWLDLDVQLAEANLRLYRDFERVLGGHADLAEEVYREAQRLIDRRVKAVKRERAAE